MALEEHIELKQMQLDSKMEENAKENSDMLKNSCNICFRTFTKPDSLKCHQKSVHEEIKTKCSICGMQLASGKVSALYSHIRSVHKSVKKFKCDICDHQF